VRRPFDALYGRPSIAPKYILRALLLQVFYSVRSERLLVEQIDYNLLFRWFVGWDDGDGRNFHGQKRSNKTDGPRDNRLSHQPEPSQTDRERPWIAETDRIAQPGQAARTS
jgi:hypothetical protein